MNALPVLLFGLVWFIFAYYWYGNKIRKKLLRTDDKNPTPSHELQDGKDFVPSKPSILFGHHFSSIAGAGPIVGPILAFAYFGWLPAILWILIGSVFMGAVHDYTALMVSVRNKGKSIVDISDKIVSKKSKAIFTAFVWITLMLIQAVFADLVAKTLVEKPEIVIPTASLIVLALLFGYFVFRKGMNDILATVIALGLLFVAVLLGEEYPINGSFHFWLALTFIYAFLASILPVQTLLQPRDYLSMYILLVGLIIGIVGTLVLNPVLNAPAYVGFEGPKGPLFPILFITIACGAISGFHSLVSSGTSSKQLNREGDGQLIAYGGMLMEGLLALLVIVMIGGVLFWSDGSSLAPQGMPVFQELLDKSAILVFGNSLGITAESIGIPLAMGTMFGVLMMKAFILTTLDTSARLNRYITQEAAPAKLKGFLGNRYVASSLSLIVAYILCLFDGYKVLWPMFGSSNQLIATLALFVISAYLFGVKAPRWYTLIPGIIMLIVTESSLVYQLFAEHIPSGKWHLAFISAFLFLLGLMVAYDSMKKIKDLSNKMKTA